MDVYLESSLKALLKKKFYYFRCEVCLPLSSSEMKKAKPKKGDSPTCAGEQLAEKPSSNESEADGDICVASDSTVTHQRFIFIIIFFII